MYKYIKRICVPLLVAIGYTVMSTASVEARLVYSTEEDGVHVPAFYLNQDDTSDDFVDLNFGTSSGAQLRYDVINDDFTVNKDLDLAAQELQNFKIERLAAAPTCNVSNEGRMYFNTTSSKTFVCDGTVFNVLENAGAITGADITDGTIGDQDLDLADITLADFTNDAGFVTTDTDTTYTGSGGITLTGTDFTADLGTDIDVSEIVSAGVGDADKVLTTSAAGVPQWEVKSNFATAAQGTLADSALQSGDNVSSLTNDAGYLTAEVDASITNEIQDLSLAGNTLSLTDDGTTVDLSGYLDNTDAQDLSLTGDTLSLTNDGTTVDLSGYTNTDAQDLTLTGNTLALTNDGTTVDLSSYLDNTDELAGLSCALNEVAKWNGSAWACAVDVDTDTDTTYTAGTGLTLIGTTISNDLGTSIDETEIDADSIQDSEMDYTAVTLADFTNDAGFVTTDNDTTYTGSGGITLTGTDFTADLGTDIDVSEIVSAGVGDADKVLTTSAAGVPQWEVKSNFATAAQGTLADSALQSGDNVSSLTNDAGYLTAEVDASITNEIQDLSLAGNTLSLTDDGTTVDLSGYTNTDAQDLTLTGNTLALTNDGTTVDLSGYLDNTDTTYTAGTGLTLTGTTFSNDLGTDIQTGEIGDNEVTLAKIADGGANQVLTTDGANNPQWENKANFATSAQGALADTALQSGDNVSSLTNDAGYLTAEAQDISLSTNNLSITGGSTVDLSGYLDNTDAQDLTLTGNTLALTNDGTTVDLSSYLDNTDALAGLSCALNEVAKWNGTAWACAVDTDTDAQDLTLTGNTLALTNDGTTVDLTSYLDNTDALAGLSCALNEVAKWNGTAWACAVDTDTDTTYTAGTGLTLTGTSFSNDLGTNIDVSEIVSAGLGDANKMLTTDATGVPQWEVKSNFATSAQGALADTALQSGDNVSVLTNDAGYLTAEVDASITNEIQDLSLTGDTLSLTDDGTTVDLSGYANTDNQDLSLAGNTLSLTNDGTTVDLSGYLDNTDELAGLSCALNEVAKWNGSAWVCATDAGGTTYSAGTGLTLVGTTFSNDLGTSIDSTEITNSTILSEDIATNAITSVKILNDAVTTNKILDDAVTSAKINDGTITADDLAFNSVDSDEIVNGAVDTNELADDAVTSAKMANSSVTGGTGGIIQDASITAADLAFNSVDSDEIVNGAVDTNELADDAVTSAKISDGTISANDLGTNSVDSDEIAFGAVGSSEIDTDAVQDAEIDYLVVTLSDFTNDAGYITTDTDDQNLSFTGNTLNITDGTGVDLTPYLDNTDAQDLSLTGDTLSLTNDGTTVDLSGYTNTDAQDLTLTGNTLALTNDGTTVDLSGYLDNTDTTYTAGTGLTLTGTTFSNDLGTDIQTGEIGDNEVTLAKIADGGANQVLTTDGANNPQWENKANFVTSTLTAANILVGNGSNVATAVNPAGDVEIATDGTTTIQDNAVDGTDIALGSDAAGDTMYYNGTDWVRLAAGTADQVLQMNTGATAPVWNNSTATKYEWIDIFGCVRGSASAGTVGGGNSPVIRFDAGGNSQMRCAFPVPSDWQSGTDINVETYYSPSDNTAGDVKFVLRHAAFGIGETISSGAFTDTLTGAETIAANTQLDVHELVGDIPAATLAADDMINLNLRRQPGDASDTYAGDINIHQIRISYTGKTLQ